MIDVSGLFRGYLRRWYWFALSVIICGCIGYVYIKTHPQKRQILSSILVSQDDGTASMLNGLGGLFGADPYVQDEIFVIKSHTVLTQVVKELGINKLHTVKTGFLSNKLEYPDYPVDVYCDESIIDTLSAGLDFKVKVYPGTLHADVTMKANGKEVKEVNNAQLPVALETVYGVYVVNITDTYKDDGKELVSNILLNGYDGAAESLTEEIGADIASKKSNVIELSMQTTNVDYGRDILNTVMNTYNQMGINERNKRASKTLEFIDQRLGMIADALNTAESDIEKYKEDKKLVDVTAEATINAQLKTQYETKLVELQTRKEVLMMTLKFLSDNTNRYELMPVAASSLGSGESAVETYNELILRRMTLLSGAKPDNRQVQQLEAQIDAVRSNIISSINQSIKSNDVAIADARSQADIAMSKLGNIPTQEREFINLKRQQEVKQQLYLFLLQRSEETAMLIANAVPKGQIIDPAYVLRDPVGTSKSTVLMFAIIVGLFIPILILYLLSLLRTKINGRPDVEKHTGLPVLGEMCFDRSGNKLVVSTNDTSASSELFRMLRANLQFVLANRSDKVVMVTSSQSGEGKSFISTNIAASLALLGKKVVIVGLDIRKPQLANYLEVSPSPGLTQYLSDSDMKINEIVREYDEVPGLDLIVAGPIPPNPGELMTSPRLEELFEYLREHYDYVVLDTAPVGMVSDALNLTRFVDATIYVVYHKKTRLQDLRFISDLAEQNKLKRVNIVVNGSKEKKGYGYGYK